jgi:hypothetical protein
LPEQVRRLEKKVDREKLVLAALPELSLCIVKFAREHGRVTIGNAVTLTGANRNTLKQHFRNLVERQHLKQLGRGRGVGMNLGDLFALAKVTFTPSSRKANSAKKLSLIHHARIGRYER